jgi:ABC-type branched-subunit amino acid transport system permease subunit
MTARPRCHLAGGIYAYYLGYVAPGTFPVVLSIQWW